MSDLKFFWLLIFTLLFGPAFSQDLILRKDGGIIPCRIVLVDSTAIYYKRPSAGNEEYILRNEVERFIVRSATKPDRDAGPLNAKNDLLYFTAKFGRGFPQGVFASQDLDNLEAGLALPGNVFQLFVTYKADPWIGISLGYRYQEFQFNKSLLEAELRRVNQGIDFSTTVAPWKIAGVHAAAEVCIPLLRDRSLTLDLFGMAGLPRYSYPSFNIRASQNGFSITLTENAPPEKEPCYTFGGKLSFRPAPNVIFHLQSDYLSGKAIFRTVFNAPGVTQVNFYQQKFNALSVSLGVSVVIQKTK